MSYFHIAAVVLFFASLGSFLNYKFAKFPATIAQMMFALLLSAGLIAGAHMGLVDSAPIISFVTKIDFATILLHYMLPFLLFAGALHVNVVDLKTVKVSVTTLATLGVLLATFITGTLVWYAAQFLGINLPYIYALLFGALISPTDPIAVLSILSQMGLSKRIYARVAGESLFNDGVGLVVFLTILAVASSGAGGDIDLSRGVELFIREAFGGVILGVVLGFAFARIMRFIHDHKLQILFSLTLVVGGSALAEIIHVSAPLCMVAAGLVVGGSAKPHEAESHSHNHLYLFWELMDDVLNSVLFLLVGFELLVVPIEKSSVTMGGVAIAAVLIGRYISVAAPIRVIALKGYFERGTITLLTWGGLRGGLSIAMALSLPTGPHKPLILAMTYAVVMFSIIVQGLTFKRVVKLVMKDDKPKKKK